MMGGKYIGQSIIYSDMLGVDFSLDGSSISKRRFAYLENMYRDYDGEGSGIVESIPGYRKVCSFGNKINGLFSYKTAGGERHIVVHAKDTVYDSAADNPDTIGKSNYLTGAKNSKSRAVSVGDALYVFDGEKIFKCKDGVITALNELSEDIYVPTVFYNGERYEQNNLLTRRFYEIFNLGSCDASAYGSEGLRYIITDSENKTCELIGCEGEGCEIYVPSRVLIGEEYYYVKSIGKNAFKNNANITRCQIANGITNIGYMAFNACQSLSALILPDTVEQIGNAAFSGCLSLTDFHLGAGVKRLGDGSFNTCPKLSSITYGGTESDFASVINATALSGISVIYEHKICTAVVAVEINSPCTEVLGVTAGGENIAFRTETDGSGLCKRVVMTLADKTLYHGKDVRIYGNLSTDTEHYQNGHRGFVASNFTGEKRIASVIFSCSIAENFDGRVFLTGNPDYPGFCFYSTADLTGENNPLYFGEMNYFKDGIGNFANTAMLACGDSLAVFKEDDDGSGSIYYHTPHDTGTDLVPRIYPVSYIHSGITAKGGVISFFDDPIFLSEKGVTALSKQQINLQRSIAVRSGNINPYLLRENIAEASLALWRGYLAVLTDGRIYLADSRAVFENSDSDIGYEWYYLSGIGSYVNDSRIYRYSSVSHTGYDLHENADTVATGTVYSVTAEGETVFYISEGNKKYEVYPTDELTGGTFYPAKLLLAVGERLFFATSCGDLLLFNNDKRGTAPDHVREAEGFDEEEYKKTYGRRIHPYYYSFAGHAPRYALQTKKDNCSLPHLEKSTVKGSLAIKCRAVASGKISCEVGCDGTGYREVATFPASTLEFSDIDFSNLSLSTEDVYTVPIKEKSKGWIEKQITVYTNEFGSPFGIYAIAYRFYVKGKIKKGR